MRFFPDIRYGTENYPEKVARRLRALNLTTWCGAAIAVFGCATVVILEFLDPKPGLWKAGTVHGLAALIFASIPLLHRFGTLWSALIGTSTVQAYFFSLTWLFGTGSGGQMSFLMAAALNFILIGTERILLSAVLGALVVLQVVVLEIMVPYDTGLLDATTLFAVFVGTVIVNVAFLIGMVTFVLRETERAEANLADKSRQLEIADRYKSHFSPRRATTYASRSTPSTYSLPNCRPKRSRRSATAGLPH